VVFFNAESSGSAQHALFAALVIFAYLRFQSGMCLISVVDAARAAGTSIKGARASVIKVQILEIDSARSF
jgi:hypothetical protein